MKEVWLIDGLDRTIEVVDLEGSRSSTDDRPIRSRAIEGFALVRNQLFV